VLIELQASEAAAASGHTYIFLNYPTTTQAHLHSSDHDMLIELQAFEAAAAARQEQGTQLSIAQEMKPLQTQHSKGRQLATAASPRHKLRVQ
jgi:hypothetical protein